MTVVRIEFAETFRLLQECTTAILSGQATALTYVQRGGAYRRLHSLAAAVEDYGTAITFEAPLDPAHLAQAHDSRGECYRELSRYAEAIADGELAVRLAPDQSRYRMNLGHVRYWAGDYQGALADLNHAIELNPAEGWAYGYRGRVHRALNREAQAIADFSKALEAHQAEPLLYGWRAEAYLRLGGYREAEADCSTGLILDPSDWRLWACRGWARYKGLDSLAEALGDFIQSLQLGADPDSYLGRALVYHALGADNAAASDFSVFIACHPAGAAAGLREVASILAKLNAPPVAVSV